MNLLLFQKNSAEFLKLQQIYLPHIMQNAKTSKMFLNVYFEKHFEKENHPPTFTKLPET